MCPRCPYFILLILEVIFAFWGSLEALIAYSFLNLMWFSNSVKESWNKIWNFFYCFATLVLYWRVKSNAIKFNVEVKTEILEKRDIQSSCEYETILTALQSLHKVVVIVVLVVVEVVVVIIVIVKLLFSPEIHG